MFYIPNLPYAFYLAAKAKHPTFFSAANPSIKSAGNGTESKFETIQLVPKKHQPKSVLHTVTSSIDETLARIKSKAIDYPCIVKPDIGFRGLLVKKIYAKNELISYLKKYPIAIIIQEFVDLPNECGVFFYKNPKTEKVKITSLTLKKYIRVFGDGKSSIQELIIADDRAKLYKEYLLNSTSFDVHSIPKKDEEIVVSTIGNHSKGTQFLNGNHLISKTLEENFSSIINEISGLFYGRIDLKYNTFHQLEKGEHFKILEINGIIAEPTHIYDATSMTYAKALQSIRTHWKFLYEVATTNHKEFNVAYKNPFVFLREVMQLKKYSKTIKKLSKTN